MTDIGTQTHTTQILIVGAGQAGAQAAISLRQEGFAGPILIVGAEPDLPYERPPLSKDYLAGEKSAERLLLRPAHFWAERDIAFRLNCRITQVSDHVATAEDGSRIRFEKLIWAAGGQARTLSCPGHDLAGVHVIRTRADADHLRQHLETAQKIVVIGGGYVGLEAAAVLRKQGKSVTLVEAQSRLLARVAGPEVSAFYKDYHQAQGVEILLDAQVDSLLGTGQVQFVKLADGRELAADAVIVGIGLIPCVAPLGLDVIEVDAHCRTPLPDIYAIGDCATHQNPFADNALIRLESVQNAVDMAKAAAGHIVHGDTAKPYHACPWFWSNQYDLKLQTVGLSVGYDQAVVRGDPSSTGWSLVYLRAGAVIALDCINSARDYVQGKALVERAVRPDLAQLADTSIALKQLLG